MRCVQLNVRYARSDQVPQRSEMTRCAIKTEVTSTQSCALRTVKETGIPHVSGGPKGAGPADTFRRFGADEWNALRQRFAAQG